MRSILFILPYFPKIGGVEACLFEAAKKLDSEVNIYVISKFCFFNLKSLEKISFFRGLMTTYNFVGYFYWQTGLIAPFLYLLKTKRKFLFVNSSIKFRNLRSIFFYLSLVISDKIIFDSNNSFGAHKYIKNFPLNKSHIIIPFIINFKIRKDIIKNRKKEIPFILVMRWHKDKGIDSLVDFSKKLKKKIIVFTYPIPKNLELPINITIKDGTDRNEIINSLSNSKVHISLSPKEGFSLIAYESIKCGCVPLSLASTELSKLTESYFCKKINSIDELVSTAIMIANFSEADHNSLIEYLNDSISSIPYFYQSIQKLLND